MFSTRYTCPTGPATRPAEDLALLLCAHGVGGAPGVAARHAAVIAARGAFSDVAACCLHGTPSPAAALAGIAAPRVLVLPYLMAEGHATRALLPRALAGATQDVRIARPVGVHDAMPRLIAARAETACRTRAWMPAETALLLIGHGTRRNAESGATARRHAARLATERRFATVLTAFLDEPPSVAEALADFDGKPLVAVGFFADRGSHGEDDARRLLAAADPAALYAGPLGCNPALVDVILDLAAEAEDAAAA